MTTRFPQTPALLPAGPSADTQASIATGAATDEHRRWPAIAAMLLGAFIVLGVGFGPGIAHNAAHDTRHTLTFPCH